MLARLNGSGIFLASETRMSIFIADDSRFTLEVVFSVLVFTTINNIFSCTSLASFSLKHAHFCMCPRVDHNLCNRFQDYKIYWYTYKYYAVGCIDFALVIFVGTRRRESNINLSVAR